MRFLKVICVILTIFCQGCSTVTAYRQIPRSEVALPDYEETQSFYFWGITPSARVVNTKTICKERSVNKYQTTFTAGNLLAIYLTFGIYFPRTARVWCD